MSYFLRHSSRFRQFKLACFSSIRSSSSSNDENLPQTKPKRVEAVAKIPDEDPELPKPCVFQQLTKPQRSDPIYTIEQAKEYRPIDCLSIYFKYQALADQHTDLNYALRGVDNRDTLIYQFPERTDYLIIGSGLIGSATAYYMKKEVSRAGDVLVLDKDPYSPHNCTAICNGLISSQSKSRDISRLANLSKELLRNLRNDVVMTEEDFAKIKYRPVTHLILWPESEVEEVLEATNNQTEDGSITETKLPHELEAAFPWLKASDSDVTLGTHGNQDEALVDPIGLRNLYRTLAQAHGANFILAEAIDFNTMFSLLDTGLDEISTTALVARLPKTRELKNLGFAKVLLSLGHNTPYLEARSEMESYMRDQFEDLHFIQPKLRISFSFSSMNMPVINFPVITDTDGSILVKEDFAGNFIYYLTQEESEVFLDEDQTIFMDYDSDDPHLNLIHRGKQFENYFNNVIKPRLVKRIPLMEDATFKLAYSGFESTNTHDGSPVIGPHPFHYRVLLSGGYGSRLMNYAPAVGAILKELMVADEEETYDITNFYWNRVINGRKLEEFNSLIK